MAALKRLIQFMKGYWLKFVLGGICLALVGLLTALEIKMIQPIFDDLLNPALASNPKHKSIFIIYAEKIHLTALMNVNRDNLFYLIPIALVLIFLVKGLFNYFGKYLMDSIGHRIITRLRDNLYKRILSQGLDFFHHHHTGSLISRVLNDVERLRTALSEKLSELGTEIFILIALVISAFIQDWRLTLLSFLTIPFVAIPMMRFSKKLRRASRRSQERTGDLSLRMMESLTAIQIVKVFIAEIYESLRFQKVNRDLLRENLKATRIMALTTPVVEFVGIVAVSAILFYGHFIISKGNSTLGAFGAFLATLYAMYVPVKKLSRANNIVQQALSAAERTVEILDEKPSIVDSENAIALPPLKRDIIFRNVSFQYSSRKQVLKGISLHIGFGKRIALVGESGAGKSTLALLIPRFFDPTAGVIEIDGIDIRRVTLASLRGQIGLVTQEVMLFNDTIKANISYGTPDAGIKEIKKAAELAYCDGFISALPKGYDTLLQEAGAGLSGGQRQRIAIARAIMKNPPILILDEATSSLDAGSEFEVQKALNNLIAGRTTIVIAHRLSTIMSADTIFVLHDGKIAEEGTHDSLIDLHGIYENLYRKEYRCAIGT